MLIPLMSFHEAEKRISGKTIFRSLKLTIYAGECLAIIGDNGTGKSTLLKLIGGLGILTKGVRELHRQGGMPTIGYVPDRFPKVRFNGFEYLRHMGSIRGISIDVLESRIQELFLIFGLESEAAKRPIKEYSKGMIQKINLMQSILEPPELLLLDEPLSGLDLRTQKELYQILFSLKTKGIAIVMTSHEPGLTERLADRIVMLDKGQITDLKQNSSKVNKHNVIEFGLPESVVIDTGALKEGVLEWKKSKNRYWFRVNIEQSDTFLKYILDCNGHIYSVVLEEEILPCSTSEISGVSI